MNCTMPFEVMDQRSGTGSHFFEDSPFSAERQFGFWKSQTTPDYQGRDGLASVTGCKLHAEKPPSNGMLPVIHAEMGQSILARDGKSKVPVGDGSPNISNSSIDFMDHDPKLRSIFSMLPASHSLGRTSAYGTQWESSLFSSSFSDIFSKKLQLSGNDIKTREPEKTLTSFREEEPFVSLEEIEAQTIGNLLPAEDDLFSGVTNDLGSKAHGNNVDDLEDFDLFSSTGGMELEGDERYAGRRNPAFFGGAPSDQGSYNGSVVGEHPNGEHPSRTLFVRNINSNVEDSELKSLFQQYGDVRTLYTACKHRGFVMISYYDTRAARNAMRMLQNKPLRRRKLDIHYSIPKDNPSDKDTGQGTLVISNLDASVTKDELHKIFCAYGEIKEIRDRPHKNQQKCIEYYDIRAAEAALSALNRSCIAGKQIELEHSNSGGSRWLMEQPDQELAESSLCNNFDDYLSRQLAAISPGIISSGCMDNGSAHVRHSVAQSPSGTFVEPHWSSSVPSNSPSPAAVVSISKQQYGLNEHHCNMDNIKFGNQCLPSFHPHSLPDYHDGLVNRIPYTSSSIGSMACNIGSNVTEAVNNMHVGAGSNGRPMELKGGVFGSAGNGTGPLPGHHYLWNNSNLGHPQSPSHMIWSNSQSFVSGIHSHHLPQMTGFPRPASVMLNTTPALHHVGSAPAVNPSIWERRHAYSGESPDASRFYLGSAGSVAFSGGSPPHPLEVASHKILSPSVGSFMDMTRSTSMCSPQQMSHIFPGRNTIISMPSSFDSPNERMRMSQRRTDSNGNHSDKKQYELDIERILRGEDSRTTLMIKNIPNKYTSKMLLAAIDEFCRGTYDFIYLPIDFKNKCNVGYAFINMIEPQQIIPFHKAFNGKKWEKFNSEKVASLAYARIQGKSALVAHFQNSSLMNEDKRCRPILFHTDGPNAGDPEPFPMGTNIRSRMGKHRTNNNDDIHQNENHSILANGEDSSNGTDSSSSSD